MNFSKLSSDNKPAKKQPRRKARLRGFSPDGAEIIIDSNGEITINGGTGENRAKLIRTAKVYLAVIKDYGYDIANLDEKELLEINRLIHELKEQGNY